MINEKVSALSIIYSDQKFDETMIIVACEDLSVYMLNYQTSQYLFNTSNKVDKLYVYSDNGNLTIAMKLKDCIIQNEKAFHIIEVKSFFFFINFHHFLFLLGFYRPLSPITTTYCLYPSLSIAHSFVFLTLRSFKFSCTLSAHLCLG